MESFARIASRSLHGRSICQSCLQHLRHQARRKNSSATTRYPPSKRPYHTSLPLFDQNSQSDTERQVHPLGDFYADLLATTIPKESRASTTDLPSWVPTSNDLTKAERAAKLFGNIKGSGYERRTASTSTPDETWQTINGVPVPPRPEEPENCCMSGCVHCVWDDYRDDIEEWAGRVKVAQVKAGSGGGSEVRKQAAKVELPRQEVASAASSMDDDGGGSEGLWDAPSTPSAGGTPDELFAGIPVGIREFMNVEKKIRERKRQRQEAAS